jgi:hypothetical protein
MSGDAGFIGRASFITNPTSNTVNISRPVAKVDAFATVCR